MNDRSLTCCKLSRRTPFQAELTSHPAIPVGISDVSMRLMPTRRVSGEYSRGKVPNVVVFSTAQCDQKNASVFNLKNNVLELMDWHAT